MLSQTQHIGALEAARTRLLRPANRTFEIGMCAGWRSKLPQLPECRTDRSTGLDHASTRSEAELTAPCGWHDGGAVVADQTKQLCDILD
jgi:hypothetical protein